MYIIESQAVGAEKCPFNEMKEQWEELPESDKKLIKDAWKKVKINPEVYKNNLYKDHWPAQDK